MICSLRLVLVVGLWLALDRACLSQAESPELNVIHVQVDGLRNDKGQVFVRSILQPRAFQRIEIRLSRRSLQQSRTNRLCATFLELHRARLPFRYSTTKTPTANSILTSWEFPEKA